MLCEHFSAIVVLKSFVLVLLIRMFVFMKGLMIFYLRIIPSFVLVAAHTHIFIQQVDTHTRNSREKEKTAHVALRYEGFASTVMS